MRLLLFVFLIVTVNSSAATVNESIYIQRDSIQLSTGVKIPYLTFNNSPVFSSKNARIVLNQGDDLDLWVVNNDTENHEFQIKGETAVFIIAPGDSANVLHTFSLAGLFIFHDPMAFPSNASTGLSGMIVVKDHTYSSFYWNIKEHQLGNNSTLLTGGSVDWSTYYPEYFTINGRGNPEINNDPDARIVGAVGDTLILYVSNTGQSIHPLHFHGYHAEVMYSSRNPEHVGRMKDSQGVYPSETIVFRIVPDKPGEYPIHDHNLISTTGGNMYPMGMFTTMLISP
jgi:FtsP/CotA-like multicopper oxidase with cupredoxin domain